LIIVCSKVLDELVIVITLKRTRHLYMAIGLLLVVSATKNAVQFVNF